MILPLTYSVSSCQFWAIDSHGIWIPSGAICIALPILFSWVATAFDNVWLLVGKTAPREFVDKCIYVGSTHDWRIQEVDTVKEIREKTRNLSYPIHPRRSFAPLKHRLHSAEPTIPGKSSA
ncbi:uncharacterized protein BDCG_16219 [Blastomyces dermatitidis ER-3]|uniref:Uncharacterized protein n=1 Tax=Ajellomyces dermatitidis (strain ER-3 / ATCC MYA-2586) TaxID=559297 RepID=A0ABX2VSN3_AJEDR|nr:uncharacterized protein BDCG_16219 [Blastomyces dermatitidis ER-3]EQL31327.1 hypothetical protein BDFG_06379 [Blastomyces dermatitidis ATCC 26199]EQL31328.1 hypothetical protein, variant [Blastomyces dermatitidis ATCC 26199]OAS99597.1 hypothetical protein BDCG_16219 [Blastomyces dermatitidis ER-3]